MPRHPDLPCARCGTLLWRGRGSLPEGQAVCRACRREQPHPYSRPELHVPRPCSQCGRPFTDPALRTCSLACARRGMGTNLRRLNDVPEQPMPCDTCGELTARGRNQQGRFCEACARARRRAKDRRAAAVRRGAAVVGPRPLLEDVARRDGWRCHLCARLVDPTLYFQHRDAATLDHLVPVSAGGTDEASNLALAHRGCNSRRGTRALVQPALS
ncbi:HNH endonuclease [Streptomyces sp. NBC_01233]|uniref:HNH endonuclease n=1 Tax=Streptomyces sp. NBC_01233 TaxID=2903787 RepID=UPI002E0F2A62|nr:HNH endonuclease [Streptomyces sp. NBC_01233]